ncbi:TetR/AcrR family transcriptional regulator [Agreia pratensis]|uniref:Transcriptional regulator, TetR family n=1 Tax=Agreia pratensis TaxID=150121 RepID=A0A1X7L8R2_9MICO|nr:TetR/AcrR family transcriptional regulator [Agreia pratensis]MBF4633977.1 TetR/AcrR family transcriptional regulator [Agreia pratensis]SMG49549.1 transcriptional regulator, TetR family [Agreia pratensis]
MNRRVQAMEASKAAIIEAAGRQFGTFGYEGTSFSRIAEAMGKPKSAIGYHLFPSKLALASAVIEHQQQRWTSLYAQISEQPGLERLTAFLLTTSFDARSCPIAAGATRLLHELLEAGIEVPRDFDWGTILRQQLEIAVRDSGGDPDGIPERTVGLLLSATFGLVGGSMTVSAEEFEIRLKSLWGPLFESWGIADAVARVERVKALDTVDAGHTDSTDDEN